MKGSQNLARKCSDGIDNDSNGYTDCDDYSCNRDGDADAVAYCSESMENTAEKCSDGIDNDNNGYVDCGDFSCSQNDDIIVRQVCQEHYRNGPLKSTKNVMTASITMEMVLPTALIGIVVGTPSIYLC